MAGYVKFDFPTENDAKEYLWALLKPYFAIQREVGVRHLIAGNRLRIDALARPRDGINFGFEWFGIEVKRPVERGEYNAALKQAIDYTHCEIDDNRQFLARINHQRILRVYLFPGVPDDTTPTIADTFIPIEVPAAYWVNRLAGKFHVGMIYEREFNYPPYRAVYFKMSAETHWSSHRGPRATPIHTRQRIGSGTLRRDE